jgi:DNA replication protein DnaC
MSHSDLTAEERAEWAAARRRRIAAGRDSRQRRSGMPSALAAVALDDQAGPAAESAKRWAEGLLPGLILHGDLGVGKTYLGAAACLRMLERRRVQWCSVASLVARSFGSQDQREWVADILSGTDALVLDDVDKVKPGPWVSQQLYAAINARVDADAPLFVTCNLAPDALEAFFGEQHGGAIMSRLDGYCEIHHLAGRDRRQHSIDQSTEDQCKS